MANQAPAPASSTAAPSAASVAAGKAAGRARHQANLKKYGNPLPIFLPAVSGPGSSSSSSSSLNPFSSLSNYFSTSSSTSSKILIPECIGTLDPHTRSIWVTDPLSIQTIFTRGFFGKGSLSRSEPSWRDRRVDAVKGGESAAAELLREKRRVERRKFKIDRAQAMLDAAKQAEAVLTGTNSTASVGAPGTPAALEDENEDDGQEGDNDGLLRPASPTPSTATSITTTVIDPTTLTPQTFLVRPTRPDSNRNRGRNAFRRRPATATTSTSTSTPVPAQQQQQAATEPVTLPQTDSAPAPAQIIGAPAAEDDEDDDDEGSDFDEAMVEEMEHLQLGLEEALFLSLGLGVLKIYDPVTETYPAPGPDLFSLLLTPSTSLIRPLLTTPSLTSSTPIYPALLPDDPLLVSYVAYHHYRSLGWVVKTGIKFCADWLLYRKGPAFSHSAFAMVVIPVYSDPADKVKSPFGETDWYEERISWKWMNTIMRVNSLVQKTVIAVYVTIPSLSSFPSSAKLPNGSLDLAKNDLDSLLRRYTIREVSLTRFGPARRRD